MAGQKLGLGTYVEDDDTPSGKSVDELRRGQKLDLVALPEVLVGEDGDLGDVSRGDITNGSPQLANTLACESVVDPSPVSTRVGEAALGKQSQMVRGRSHALTRFGRDLLDRPLALREQVDDLGATPARERGGNRRKCIEERSLRIHCGNIFKLSFEYMSVKK